MSCRVYYNDHEPFVAQWLRNLIQAGHLPDGDVDERSITEVQPDDLRGYDQCHFFAGIGGWAYALQLAGWGDRPVWTGSCPCQPFSAAGKGEAHEDERHLWPDFFRLIRECRPERVVGEQVAGAVGLYWLDGVCTDLEAEAYTVGSVVLGAHSVGAPHIRQRLYWVAAVLDDGRQSGGLAHTERDPRGPGWASVESRKGAGAQSTGPHAEPGRRGDSGALGLDDPEQPGLEGHAGNEHEGDQPGRVGTLPNGSAPAPGGSNGWSEYLWLPCLDGKARRIKPGLEPLVDGLPGRVGRLRAYGNAIVPQVAAEFLMAYMEIAGVRGAA